MGTVVPHRPPRRRSAQRLHRAGDAVRMPIAPAPARARESVQHGIERWAMMLDCRSALNALDGAEAVQGAVPLRNEAKRREWRSAARAGG
jgi:hypothetical protein